MEKDRFWYDEKAGIIRDVEPKGIRVNKVSVAPEIHREILREYDMTKYPHNSTIP